MMYVSYLEAYGAVFRIECSETTVAGIRRVPAFGEENPGGLCPQAVSELSEYFAGKRTRFDLCVCPQGTAFQKRVWDELVKIPFGQTRSYGEIAEAVGGKRYARAVGSAVHRNPVLILIPCHRVIGADGSLTGFAAGLDLKERLLNLEKARLKQNAGNM